MSRSIACGAYPRQVLPAPPAADVVLPAFTFMPWAAVRAAGGAVAVRIVAFGSGACRAYLYSVAITMRLRSSHRSRAMVAEGSANRPVFDESRAMSLGAR